jgi:hypothetical protein
VGRPRKDPREWITEQAIKKLFPKRAVKQLKKAAEEAKPPSEKPSTKKDSKP